MEDKQIFRQWKKVVEENLPQICLEAKEVLPTPALIILEGPMGIGKTTLVKAFALGHEVTSPTYSLLNQYGSIVHGDFYRLTREEEIYECDFSEYAENAQIIFLEWGKNFLKTIKRELPDDFAIFLWEIKESSVGNAGQRDMTLYRYK